MKEIVLVAGLLASLSLVGNADPILGEYSYNGKVDARSERVVDWCGGEFNSPSSCTVANKDCEYYAKWEYFEGSDDIQFEIQTSHTDLWTGIGFSDNDLMPNSDIVVGWEIPQGGYAIYDGWADRRAPPSWDSNQGIYNTSYATADGIMTLGFVRKRESQDADDLSFTDADCLYMFFPVMGGSVDYVNDAISKHQETPIVSSEKICISSCG